MGWGGGAKKEIELLDVGKFVVASPGAKNPDTKPPSPMWKGRLHAEVPRMSEEVLCTLSA